MLVVDNRTLLCTVFADFSFISIYLLFAWFTQLTLHLEIWIKIKRRLTYTQYTQYIYTHFSFRKALH